MILKKMEKKTKTTNGWKYEAKILCHENFFLIQLNMRGWNKNEQNKANCELKHNGGMRKERNLIHVVSTITATTPA